jgi:putative transposase
MTKKSKHPTIIKTVAVKLRLDLDLETRGRLDGQSRIANWLWNNLLEQANLTRDRIWVANKTKGGAELADIYFLYGEHKLRDYMVGLKETKPFLKALFSSPTKNVALRLSRAIRDTRDPVISHRKTRLGWPKFNKWGKDWFSLEYDEPSKGYQLLPGGLELRLGRDQDQHKLKLFLPFHESRPDFIKPELVKALRIVKEHEIYYAILTVNRTLVAQKPLPAKPKVIVFDPGHISPLTGYDTDHQVFKLERPTFIRTNDQSIDETKSRRDHCQRRAKRVYTPSSLADDGIPTNQKKYYWLASRRWRYYNGKLQKLNARRQEQLTTWANTWANYFYSIYDACAMGNYSPDGQGLNRWMRRSMNNQSAIGALRKALKWVALRSGKKFLDFDEYDTTKTCAQCLYILPAKIEPGIETWICPHCQSLNDRDGNAAINGFLKIMEDYPELHLDNPRSGSDQLVQTSGTWRLTKAGLISKINSTSEQKLTGLPAIF